MRHLLEVEGHGGAAHHGAAALDASKARQHILRRPAQCVPPQLQAGPRSRMHLMALQTELLRGCLRAHGLLCTSVEGDRHSKYAPAKYLDST